MINSNVNISDTFIGTYTYNEIYNTTCYIHNAFECVGSKASSPLFSSNRADTTLEQNISY